MLRYTVPFAGFWYGKERLHYLRQQESDKQYKHDLQLRAKIKQVEATKNAEIAEINKKHHDQVAALEIEILKAQGKYIPPPSTGEDSESVKFVDNLLAGKWENWMDTYLSDRLVNDLNTVLENPEAFNKASKSLLDKMNTLK